MNIVTAFYDFPQAFGMFAFWFDKLVFNLKSSVAVIFPESHPWYSFNWRQWYFSLNFLYTLFMDILMNSLIKLVFIYYQNEFPVKGLLFICFMLLVSSSIGLEAVWPFKQYVLDWILLFIYTDILNNYYACANKVNSDYEVKVETRIIIISHLSSPPCKKVLQLDKRKHNINS